MALILVSPCFLNAASSNPPDLLQRASWIWGDTNAAICQLRTVLVLPENPSAASLFITADNGYEVFVNGSLVGSDVGVESDVWSSVERYELGKMLTRGKNVIGILGSDLGGVRGVVAAVRVEFAKEPLLERVTDGSWRASTTGEPKDYSHPEFIESAAWKNATVIGPMGMAPWGKLSWSPGGMRQPKSANRLLLSRPEKGFNWPARIAFLEDDCSTYVPLRGDAWGVVFRVRDWSRAYTEFDLPCPSKIARKLCVLSFTKGANADPDRRVLFDAGSGVIGSPSATFDGQQILLAMAREGEKFFHIYRIASEGGAPEQLTSGPFHDIDPAELPDGRIVFTSTRVGTFEEYHSPPSRALFVMKSNGSDIQPITSTLIFDNEPKVMADGRIVFVRTDNFFDRGKVETHLHVIRPDGTDGLTEIGADVGADYGVRLRVLGYGSPAPLPDGRLAFISNRGNFIASLGHAEPAFHRLPDQLSDLAAMPDGRLLATIMPTPGHSGSDTIGVIDPATDALTELYRSSRGSIHSPVYLGERARPPVIPSYTGDVASGKTGFLLCQNARFTRKTKAGWANIRSIRVLSAIPLTVRSSHSHIVHVGHQTVELGTVPLAPDGSFYIEVPADTPLALQAVDAEGRSELNEMSWIYVRPGEQRACMGCHQPRELAPSDITRDCLALRTSPVKLLGQGEPHRFRGNNPGVTGMMDLQFERFRECASLNLHESKGDNEGTAALLVEQLGGKDQNLRVSAAQRLGILREQSAVGALQAALLEGAREARLAAIVALGACGGRASVPSLLAAMEDEDPVIAQAAVVAMENITGQSIRADLFTSVSERQADAQTWRKYFAEHSWTRIEAALIDNLKQGEGSRGESREVRRAVIALGHIGGPSGAEAVRGFVAEKAKHNPYPAFEADNRTDVFTFPADSPLNPRTLQEAVRSLGQLRDKESVAILSRILASNIEPRTANLFLAEAAAEALGRIGTTEAEAALISTFSTLKNYWDYVGWYSDHPALYACHSSPIHARIIHALDRIGSTKAAALVPALIRSVPTDPDRALFPFNDDYEDLVGRTIRRAEQGREALETCLSILGDQDARPNDKIKEAICATHPAWGGTPGPENRAAQILSLVCRDASYEPRVRAAFGRFLHLPEEPIKRELGNPTWSPIRHWVLFYLARSLGNLSQPSSTGALMIVLRDDLNEARHGRPDPATPLIHFLHLDYTPCWRAAAAWALGKIGDSRSAPILLHAVENMENAPDVRHSAAVALRSTAPPEMLPKLGALAAHYPEMSTRRALLQACETLAGKEGKLAALQITPDVHALTRNSERP